jgi:limonene-1,2-epoxide hydrolase
MTRQDAAGDDTGGMFAAIDRKDSTAFVGYLTDDAVFRFGSAPAVHGRDAIQAAVDAFFDSIAASAHSIRQTLTSGNTRVCEGEVTYTRLDGGSVTLPFADVFEYNGDRIAEYKIYIDIAPLQSACA